MTIFWGLAGASYNKFNLNKFSEISSETGNLEIRSGKI